jgi:hypothetical protein
VAIEQANFDESRNGWRTRLHLRGGTSVVVDSDFEIVEARLRTEARMTK